MMGWVLMIQQPTPALTRFLRIRVITVFVALVSSLLIPLAQIDAQTQAEMNAEASADFVKADAELNKTYGALLKELPDAESKEKLKQSQRAWLAFRDAEAEFEGRGGSMAPTLRYATKTDLTEQRTKQLKARLDEEAAPNEKDASTSSPTPTPTPASSASTQGPDEKPAAVAPNPTSVSPDKQWEYKPVTDEHGPQVVKAGTAEAVGDLSDDCSIGSCGDDASVLWAPDSKRFAFYWGQGRTHQTSFYQLRDEHWEAVKPGPNDELSDRLQSNIIGQLKKSGQSEEKLEKNGLYLRFIWQEIKLDRWTDANTAVLFAGQQNVIAKRDEPGEMSDGFGAHFLFTIKFDDAGKWKLVKTQRVSEKEAEKQFKEE
jgi:uncharacterized protein YecT (DUF1311 family)